MALDQLHGEVGTLVGELAQFVDRHDARVLQLAADLGLLDETPPQLGVVLVRRQQHLDGNVAAQVSIAALEDGAHAAAGDLAGQLITRRQRKRFGRHRRGVGPDDRGGRLRRRLAQLDPRPRLIGRLERLAGQRRDGVGEAVGGRLLQEAAGSFVPAEQGLDALPQGGIAGAGLVQVGGLLRRGLFFQGSGEEV